MLREVLGKIGSLTNRFEGRVILSSLFVMVILIALEAPLWVVFLAGYFNGWGHHVLKTIAESQPKIDFNVSGEGVSVETERFIRPDTRH